MKATQALKDLTMLWTLKTKWNDLYLELEDFNDLVMSTDSSKKRKHEERDECSSHHFN